MYFIENAIELHIGLQVYRNSYVTTSCCLLCKAFCLTNSITHTPVYDSLSFISLTQVASPDQTQQSGGRLNKKDGLTRYGDSHVKDKTS